VLSDIEEQMAGRGGRGWAGAVCGRKTVAEQGVSDEKDLLILIKTVFAKLDSRLG